MTFPVDDELERGLDALTQADGPSRQELIRRIALERSERAGHRARVEESLDRMIVRWGAVLGRLGSV